jgi:hypothetical protein
MENSDALRVIVLALYAAVLYWLLFTFTPSYVQFMWAAGLSFVAVYTWRSDMWRNTNPGFQKEVRLLAAIYVESALAWPFILIAWAFDASRQRQLKTLIESELSRA